MAQFRQILPGETGPELFEWIAVTLILTLGFLILLQAVGPQVQTVFDWLSQFVARLAG